MEVRPPLAAWLSGRARGHVESVVAEFKTRARLDTVVAVDGRLYRPQSRRSTCPYYRLCTRIDSIRLV